MAYGEFLPGTVLSSDRPLAPRILNTDMVLFSADTEGLTHPGVIQLGAGAALLVKAFNIPSTITVTLTEVLAISNSADGAEAGCCITAPTSALTILARCDAHEVTECCEQVIVGPATLEITRTAGVIPAGAFVVAYKLTDEQAARRPVALCAAQVRTAEFVGVPIPVVFPVLYYGTQYDNLIDLLAAVEAITGTEVAYDPVTNTLTQVGGGGVLADQPLELVDPCYLTAGVVYNDFSGARQYTLVDCPPGQRALYTGAGFTVQNRLDGSFLTMLKTTPGTVCGLEFTEPFYDYAGGLVGYLPY
jgi:hypothetical protein